MKTLSKVIIVATVLFCGQASAADIGFGVSAASANVNDTITIDIVGSNFSSNVDGGGVNLAFDSSIVNVVSVTIDESVWDFGGAGISTGTIDNTAGTVEGIMVNTFGNVTGDFVVATIELTAVGAGTTDLLLSDFLLNPWASGGSLLDPAYLAGAITVNAAVVPVPAAVWLFGSGILGLIGVAKRKVRA